MVAVESDEEIKDDGQRVIEVEKEDGKEKGRGGEDERRGRERENGK